MRPLVYTFLPTGGDYTAGEPVTTIAPIQNISGGGRITFTGDPLNFQMPGGSRTVVIYTTAVGNICNATIRGRDEYGKVHALPVIVAVPTAAASYVETTEFFSAIESITFTGWGVKGWLGPGLLDYNKSNWDAAVQVRGYNNATSLTIAYEYSTFISLSPLYEYDQNAGYNTNTPHPAAFSLTGLQGAGGAFSFSDGGMGDALANATADAVSQIPFPVNFVLTYLEDMPKDATSCVEMRIIQQGMRA